MPHPSRFHPTPESAGLDPEKLAGLFARAEREVSAGLLPSAQIAVARGRQDRRMRSFGRASCEGREAASDRRHALHDLLVHQGDHVGGRLAAAPGGKARPRRAGRRHHSPSSARTGRRSSRVEQLLHAHGGLSDAPSGSEGLGHARGAPRALRALAAQLGAGESLRVSPELEHVGRGVARRGAHRPASATSCGRGSRSRSGSRASSSGRRPSTTAGSPTSSTWDGRSRPRTSPRAAGPCLPRPR